MALQIDRQAIPDLERRGTMLDGQELDRKMGGYRADDGYDRRQERLAATQARPGCQEASWACQI